MKSKKLLFITVVLIFAATAVLTGCGQDNGDSQAQNNQTQQQDATTPADTQDPVTGGEDVTISFWGGWTGPDVAIMQELVDMFMADNPNITIDFETEQWTPLFTRFLAESAVGNAPHIFAMRPMDAGQFIYLGLMDMNFAETIGINSANYSTSVWESTMFEGNQYAIPLDQHMHAVFYNRSMLDAAGITAPPVTGPEFIEAARLMTLDGSGRNATENDFDPTDIVQFGLNFPMNHHVGFQMSALISQQGGTPFTADMTEVPFDTQQAINALTFIQDLVLTYRVVPIGDASAVDTFVAENVAMFIDGPWQMATLAGTDLDWGTTPYPVVFGHQSAWGNSHIFTFPVSNASPAQQEAMRVFITWMSENSGGWAHAGHIPANIVGSEYAATLFGRGAFIDSMENMYILPASPRSAELFGSSAISPFPLAAQSLLLDGEDPAVVVENLRNEMNSILAMP